MRTTTHLEHGWALDAFAVRVASDLPKDSYVNVGIGLPTLVPKFLSAEQGILAHSENGIIGIGPPAESHEVVDPDLIDATKDYVTLVPGASIVDHATSFALIRGGHLAVAILGGMQVSRAGDLANWRVPDQDLGSVGGAMDLAVGAQQLWIMMRHVDRQGRPKIVQTCSYPLTGLRCVSRIYTELCVLECRDGELHILELAPGVDLDYVQSRTDVPLQFDGLTT